MKEVESGVREKKMKGGMDLVVWTVECGWIDGPVDKISGYLRLQNLDWRQQTTTIDQFLTKVD